MKSPAQVFGGWARRPSRRVWRTLWERLEASLRRRAKAGTAARARRRRDA